MPRRPLLAGAGLALLAALAPQSALGAPAGADPARPWALPEARALVKLDAWPAAIGDLGAPAERRDLARVLAAVGRVRELGPPPPVALPDLAPADPDASAITEVVGRRWILAPGGLARADAPVTAGQADRAFVAMLGLDAERRALSRLSAGGVRLRVPAGFATEVLAREAGLRRNYVWGQDALEKSANDVITRADVVDMATRALRFGPDDRAQLARFQTIALPPMSQGQREVAEAALSRVGAPYIWGGEWPSPSSPYGAQAHGGYDCSGLVWWVFHRNPTLLAAGEAVEPAGRTAAQMAAIAKPSRLGATAFAAGDLVFFGPKGPASRVPSIDHVGMSLGGGWIVHSSGSRDGVSVTWLDAYWAKGVAWGRRIASVGPPAPAPPAPAPPAIVPPPATAPAPAAPAAPPPPLPTPSPALPAAAPPAPPPSPLPAPGAAAPVVPLPPTAA
jgi:NlpC/P60 family